MNLALGEAGTFVLGIAALAWTLDCFLGLYLTLPRATAHFLRRWKPAWTLKYPATAVRVNYDIHRSGGLWLWPLLFVFGWSSVMFNLPAVYEPVTARVFDYRSDLDMVKQSSASSERDAAHYLERCGETRRRDDGAHSKARRIQNSAPIRHGVYPRIRRLHIRGRERCEYRGSWLGYFALARRRHRRPRKRRFASPCAPWKFRRPLAPRNAFCRYSRLSIVPVTGVRPGSRSRRSVDYGRVYLAKKTARPALVTYSRTCIS